MSEFQIHTFGCKVNTYDSGLMKSALQSGQPVPEGKAQVHVLNTCAVTQEATSEAIKLIRRLKNKDPNCTVVVTGCGAQVDTELFKPLQAADLIVANSHKGQLSEIIGNYLSGQSDERIFKSNIFKKEDLEAGGGLEPNHTRSFLKIQDGCNSFCTYCVIPYARGKSRSIPIAELVSRINTIAETGIKEVVLTGVHIGDYQDEVNGRELVLEDLLETILLHTKMPRIRLTSFEPVEISQRLLDLFTNDRLCAHFHMSIQSANTEVLAAMKRKYSAEQVEESLLKIQQLLPEAFIGMDVIVGFPNETEAHFEDTYQRLERLPWNRMHVFPYSERPGTRAVGMNYEFDERLKSVRAERLRNLSQVRLQQSAQGQVGQTLKTLLLKKPARGSDGLSRNYWPVKVNEDFPSSLRGQEVLTEILSWTPGDNLSRDGWLTGKIVGVVP